MMDIGLSIFLPAVGLALIGWFVPQLLARVMPEGAKPLMLLALLSTLLMGLLGMAYFLGLYLWQGATSETFATEGLGYWLSHFLRLSMISVLLWGPIMILSIAQLPRRWKKEVW